MALNNSAQDKLRMLEVDLNRTHRHLLLNRPQLIFSIIFGFPVRDHTVHMPLVPVTETLRHTDTRE
jgi:hypothetical protein